MKKSSVLEILKTFSPDDLDRFKDFILSPYFNKIKNVVKLYSEIRKYAPEFNDDNLTKEKLWMKVFPGKDYNYGIMKNLIHELSKLTENFMRDTYFKNDLYFEKALIKELSKRQLTDLLIKKIELFDKKMESANFKDEDYLDNKLFITEEISNIHYKSKLFGMNTQNSVNFSVKLFLLKFFEKSLEFYIVGSSHNVDHDEKLLDNLTNFFSDKDSYLKDVPVLFIYFLLVQCYRNNIDQKTYFETKKFLLTNLDNISSPDKKNIYFVLNNVCNRLFLKGQKEFYIELFNNHLEMFSNHIYAVSADGKIGLIIYRNFINICVHLKRTGALIDFVRDFKDKVLTKNKEAIEKYSNAFILLAGGEFDECLELCSRIPYNDFFESNSDNIGFKLDIRIIALKCQYELGLTEEALSSIDSGKHFIKNNDTLNDQTKNIYYSYFLFMKELVLLKSNYNIKKLEDLKYKVLKEGNVYHKDFFLEKISTLDKADK